MRILPILAAGVVLIILAVVVTGSLLPKRHVVSRSASYRATPEHLFSLIAGPQNWRPDVLRCEAAPDANGRELMRETTRGGETVTYELLDRVPAKSLTRRIATENLPYSGAWTYSLQPDGEITVVRITEDGQVYNPVFRFMSRFVLGHTRTMDAYLRALGKATGQEVEIKD
ncbi:MAG: SRPBCC family protein [Candidatus Sulfotelmatobacter sp.]